MDINIKNLSKSFNSTLFLDIPSLNINSGEITGIIGNNGCGKTTLLKIISGIFDYDSGNILYNDKLIDKNIRNGITLIHQRPYMLNRSVYQNLEYPLKIRKIQKDVRNKKVLDMAHSLKIEDLLIKKATKLSGGEMQKVALGRALIFEPKLLLLDEPTSGIDTQSLSIIESKIVEYKNTGGTVIIVTHSQDQRGICERIITMSGGKIIDNSRNNNSE